MHGTQLETEFLRRRKVILHDRHPGNDADPKRADSARNYLLVGMPPGNPGLSGERSPAPRGRSIWALRVGWPGKSRGSREPQRNPTIRDMAANPHRNPTNETAHSGALVIHVKGTENSRSAAPMRVSWAFGAFPR